MTSAVYFQLFVNAHRSDAISAARRTARFLHERGVRVGVEEEIAVQTGLDIIPLDETGKADLAICFGGDGTLIRAAKLCAPYSTPILGVYYGRFGFVTQCNPSEVGAAISSFLDGKALIEERMMVKATLRRGNKEIASLDALNEAAVQRAATTRMLDFEIFVDGVFLTRYPADGVVVSTPTGSTGYNLSAGGPIVDPGIQALILSAIAPHTLSARALVLHPEAEICVRIETRGDAVLSCDGQTRLQMMSGDIVTIGRSELVTRLVSVEPKDFLNKVSERLLWSREDQDDEGGDEQS